MIRNDDYFEIIKEQNKELAKFRPFKSAYEMKQEIERLNNIINELKEYIHNELVLDFYNDNMPCELIINKMENMIKKLKVGDKE